MVGEKFPIFFDDILDNLKTPTNFNPSVRKLIRASKGIAKGLTEIHSKKYMHRDIKPGNLAIRENGKGIIIDLGSLIKSGQKHGWDLTPSYAPPELMRRDVKTQSVNWIQNSQTMQGDLWSLGLTLYQIFHPQHQLPSPLNRKISGTQLNNELFKIQKNASDFKKTLFKNWTTTNKGEAKLHAVIAKLLSVTPHDRGTAREAYLGLKKVHKIWSGN